LFHSLRYLQLAIFCFSSSLIIAISLLVLSSFYLNRLLFAQLCQIFYLFIISFFICLILSQQFPK
jgi:hypothetical protein